MYNPWLARFHRRFNDFYETRARVYQRGTVDLKLTLTGRVGSGKKRRERRERGREESRRRGWQSGRTAPKLHQLPVPVSWGAIKLPTHFPGHYRASPSTKGGCWLPFVSSKRRVRKGGEEAWRGLVTASNSFEVARDRFPPPPRTVDSNCFCPGVDRVEQFPLLRGTPGVRPESGTGNRWLWHSVASNSWNLTRFWDRFDKFLRPINAISAENFVDDILQVGVMEGGKYVNEKEKSRWGKCMW